MNSSASPQVAPGKTCGTCLMCCKLLLIEELEKPAGQWCRHAAIGKGCGVYADRPPVCRSFHCQWILEPHLGPEWKPEKAKFILYLDRDKPEMLHVAVDPAFPDAWTKPPFLAVIKNWVLDGAELGRFGIVNVGSRWTAVLPDRTLELGNVEQEFALERQRGPTGRTIELRITRAAPQTPAAAQALPDS